MPIPTRSLRKPLAMAAVAALTFTLVSCAGADEPITAPAPAATVSSSAPAVPTPSESPSSSAPASPSASTATSGDDNLALLAAGALAAKEVSDSTVVSIESERNGWEVTVVTDNGGEQQLRIDADGEKVASGPTDERPDAEDRAENEDFAKVDVDYRSAVKAVTAEVDGSQVTDLTLDEENRRLVWEADVSVGSEQRSVQVDAESGKVVSNRIDD